MAAHVLKRSAAKTCIALVDDDGSIRRAVGRLLRTHGFTCVAYESAEAALADPAFFAMNCVIVDIQLNGINGFELSDRLDALGVAIPRVFITAHLEPDLPDRLGDRLLLVKPFEETLLIESITSTMGRA